jgi:uncharacterized repeat protein (TIGR03803 family)
LCELQVLKVVRSQFSGRTIRWISGRFFLQGFRPALTRLVLGSAALAAAAGLAPAQSGETILHSFKGAPDGDTPVAGVIFDSEGALYGTTKFGGLSTFGPGVVFKLTPPVPPATKWTKTVLYRFQGGNDGANPVAGLVFNSNGALFGTTSAGGGSANGGTVFKLKPPVPPATEWTEKVLYSSGGTAAGPIFTSKGPLPGTANGGIRSPIGADCIEPIYLGFWVGAVLVFSSPPGIEITANMGGTCGKGGVAKVTPPAKGQIEGQIAGQAQWTETDLYDFTGDTVEGETDGSSPLAGVIADSKGALFGTTNIGGTSDNGTVFKLKPPVSPATKWTEKVLYRFQGAPDGANPVAGLIRDSEGALYGTTPFGGGPSQSGVVFKLTRPVPPATTWTETVLHRFKGAPDGAFPQAGLIFDSKGALYGTTSNGGRLNNGAVFKLTPPVPPATKWTETVLYSFGEPPDGIIPLAGLIIDNSGALYGTTSGGGTANHGTVFMVTP